MLFVCGTSNNKFFNVSCGKKCLVIKEYFYNGESWYRLKDDDGKIFNSPTIFWDDVK